MEKVDGLYKVADFKIFTPQPVPATDYRVTYTVVPDGLYTPAELGLNLPFCTQISIGLCSRHARWKKKWTWRGKKWYIENMGTTWGVVEIAHQHDTRICIKRGNYVYRDKGIPDEVIWHEYAHILADGEKHGHDSVWAKHAKQLGIKNPTPYTNHVYIGYPQHVWGT